MIIALLTLKNAKKLTFLCLFTLFFTQNSLAKTFHILLGNNGVSADDIMEQYQTSPSPPGWLLSSFNLISPQNVSYLVAERPKATGNLQNLLNNHPQWSLAKLYQLLIVTYSDNVDESQILNNTTRYNNHQMVSCTELFQIHKST